MQAATISEAHPLQSSRKPGATVGEATADYATVAARAAQEGAPRAENAAAADRAAPPPVSSDVERDLIRRQESARSLSGDAAEAIDFDAYFSARGLDVNVTDTLLLPNEDTIRALSEHVREELGAFLQRHGLQAAPSEIAYDRRGAIRLPDNDPNSAAFKRALDDDPMMDRRLRTLHALSGHAANLFNLQSGAGRAAAEVSLRFSDDGTVRIETDGDAFMTIAGDETARSDAAEDFLEYARMTPEERYFAMFLAQEGLTQEELDALPPEERAKIIAKIEAKIEKRLALDAQSPAAPTAASPRAAADDETAPA